jgi:hypothetical protein
VSNGVAQHVVHRLNLLRSVAGWIDDCLEAAAAKRSEVPVAIAAQLFELREKVRVALAAVEENDVMAAGERGFDNVPTEEEGAAKDQDSHAIGSRAERAA